MAKRRSKAMKKFGRGGLMVNVGGVDFDIPIKSAVKAVMAGPGKATVKSIVDFVNKKGTKMSSVLPNLKGPIGRIGNDTVKKAMLEALEGATEGFKDAGGSRRRRSKKMK